MKLKALLRKDLYVLGKQGVFLLVITVAFAAIPTGYFNTFAILFASIIPFSVINDDERTHWGRMAAMMPYSTRDMVLGKYVFGWLCIGAAVVLSGLLQMALSLVVDRVFLPGVMVLSVLGAVCILAISLPLMFRMGVEKGRLAMFLVIFLVCGAAGAIAHIAESVGSGTVFAFQGPVLGVTLLAALVLTAVSVPLSMRFYTKRQS